MFEDFTWFRFHSMGQEWQFIPNLQLPVEQFEACFSLQSPYPLYVILCSTIVYSIVSNPHLWPKRLSVMPFLQKTSLLARPLHGTSPCLKKSPLTKINGSAVQLEGSPFHLQVQHLPLMHIRFNVTVSVVFFYLQIILDIFVVRPLLQDKHRDKELRYF